MHAPGGARRTCASAAGADRLFTRGISCLAPRRRHARGAFLHTGRRARQARAAALGGQPGHSLCLAGRWAALLRASPRMELTRAVPDGLGSGVGSFIYYAAGASCAGVYDWQEHVRV